MLKHSSLWAMWKSPMEGYIAALVTVSCLAKIGSMLATGECLRRSCICKAAHGGHVEYAN